MKEFWKRFRERFYEMFLVCFIFFDIGMVLIIVGSCGPKTFSNISTPIGLVLIVIVPLLILFTNRKKHVKK